MLEITIDKESCSGCAFCVLACPTNCIWMDDAGKKATVADISECIVCRNCQDSCPKGLIEVRLES
jgi:NAD-dependent dihydropyrimidine dehydrogenase PreA subunit